MAKVTLLSYTDRPIETLNAVWQASRDNEPVETGNSDVSLFQKVVASKIPVAEMIDFVFLLEGVSITLREQMVRHRIGVKVGDRIGADIAPNLADSTWWSQSMRILDMGSFAANGDYSIPDTVADKPAALDIYNGAMKVIEQAYRTMVAAGVPMEDARNVIPLAAEHRIVWKLNLAALGHIVGKRGCWILQLGVWGEVIKGMVEELATKVHPVFRDLIAPPCINNDKFTGCLFKLDNQRRIDGEDEIPPCPLYLTKHHDDAVQAQADAPAPVWQYDLIGESPEWVCRDEKKTARMERMREEYRDLWQRDVETGERLVQVTRS